MYRHVPQFADISEEVQYYLEIHFPEGERQLYAANPLLYWQTQSFRLPNLALVAKALYSTPATECPSERLFNVSGHILNVRRYRLKPQNVSALCFLHDIYHNRIKVAKAKAKAKANAIADAATIANGK